MMVLERRPLEEIRSKGIANVIKERVEEIRSKGLVPTLRSKVEEVVERVRTRGEMARGKVLTRETGTMETKEGGEKESVGTQKVRRVVRGL